MIHLERLSDILVITPRGALEKLDIETIAKEVDSVIASKGRVTGLMINIESFPGWRDFAAFSAHVKFVARNHRAIERIAVVTSSRFLKFVPRIAGIFVHPVIRPFGVKEREQAFAWLDTGR